MGTRVFKSIPPLGSHPDIAPIYSLEEWDAEGIKDNVTNMMQKWPDHFLSEHTIGEGQPVVHVWSALCLGAN